VKKSNQRNKGLEITTFKLNGYSCKAFIAANEEVDEWLKKQPGFQSRHIAEKEDGTIIDMLLWDSEEQGRTAMNRLMDELSHSPVHQMIDQSTVSWNIFPVYHQMPQ